MDAALLEKRLAREKNARKAAEHLLEEKAAELFEANQKLSAFADQLSDEIEVTRDQKERAETDLHVAEQRLWTAIDAISDGFALFDPDGTLQAANSAFCAMVSARAKRGATLDVVVDDFAADCMPVDRDADFPRSRDQIGSHMAIANGTQMLMRNARDRYINLRARNTATADIVVVATDVTQMRRQQDAFDEARQQAEAASRAKSAFLANMSHEIRTPMNGVVGMAELLGETALDDEQRLFADTIKNSGEALLTIINDVLDYSKIEAGKLQLSPADFDLERSCHDVLMLLSSIADAKGIDLAIDYDLFLPRCFHGDPGRIRQILTNLTGNAVKFTTSGHVLIRVVGRISDDQTCHIHVAVEDSGIGIPEDKLDHVFGEFSQVEEEANRKFEGTGLGLSISKRLVELMGGEIWVESQPGQGSCFGFRIELPVVDTPENDITPIPTGIRTALVVDDMPVNRMILQTQLKRLGIDPVCVDGAQSALDQIKTGFPDVILTDQHMPETDGLALSASFRAQGYDDPILLMTSGSLPAQSTLRDLDLKVLQKPILRAQLLAALHGQQEIAPTTPGPQVVSGFRDGPRLRVLLAEDNKTNRLVFQKMVRDRDMDLVIACDGQEAVECFANDPPDIIFMDVSMPRMDGMEATREIRARENGLDTPPVPIVALTAHAMEGDRERIMASGMDHFLTKPIKKGLLFEQLDRVAAAVEASPP